MSYRISWHVGEDAGATVPVPVTSPAVSPDTGIKYVSTPLPLAQIVPQLVDAYVRFYNSKMTTLEKTAALLWVSHMSQNAASGKKFDSQFINRQKQLLEAELKKIPDWEKNANDQSLMSQAKAFLDAMVKTVVQTVSATRYIGIALAVLAGAGLLYVGYHRVRQLAGT